MGIQIKQALKKGRLVEVKAENEIQSELPRAKRGRPPKVKTPKDGEVQEVDNRQRIDE
jgi:hypothetical protein